MAEPETEAREDSPEVVEEQARPPDEASRPPDDAGPPPDEALVRALADLDNLRKRFQREVARERAAERERVAAQWLPVVDNLERSLQYADEERAADAVLEGVSAVLDQALGVLAQLGYPRYDDIGEAFDPERHEAVGSVASEAPANSIVTAVHPGYGRAGSVLRPAGVIVAQGR
ncbi:MAG: grpE [Acidimicrobiales bacterium]|jgi:molecular chaperone GrpE|nr:grpE [Acidimicrobiales bacterium]